MLIKINGLEEEVAVASLSELLTARGIDPAARFLAVAVNGTVIRRSEWGSKSLGPGDDIEIVKPFSGG
ncbi:MAG: sulfur carrier protein ThiS [Alphaproteobacteria bacterium]|nr:sulfur carrier protein ThiS [Alphaproteobacteria bacterium]